MVLLFERYACNTDLFKVFIYICIRVLLLLNILLEKRRQRYFKMSKKHNAYYYFMKECQEKNAALGIKKSGMKDIAKDVAPLWEKLSAIERIKYEKLAKQTKQKNIEVTEDEEFRINMIMEIRTILEADKVEKLEFHIMHINIFYHDDSINQYSPAEIAISRFSLKNGVADLQKNVFHSLCNPGKLALGYAFEVKKICEDTHQIPYPHDQDFNLKQIFDSVLEFLSFNSTDGSSLPPVYTSKNNVVIVRQVMKNMCSLFGSCENLIKVYELEYLFFYLRNASYSKTGQGSSYPSVTFAQLELEKDVYEYTAGIGCDFHKTSDLSVHCSKSIVIRQVYVICSNCCLYFNVKTVPGQHVPCLLNVPTATSTLSPTSNEEHRKNPYPSIGGPNLAYTSPVNSNVPQNSAEAFSQTSSAKSDSCVVRRVNARVSSYREGLLHTNVPHDSCNNRVTSNFTETSPTLSNSKTSLNPIISAYRNVFKKGGIEP